MTGSTPLIARIKRHGPGRPEGRSHSRAEILDAAEMHFAQYGYEAANLRDIARDAHVTTAMVSYYFGGKAEMFRETYMRRGQWLADERMRLLTGVQAKKGYQVADVVRAYLVPPFQLRESAQGRAFLKIQARLHVETSEEAFQLRRDAYDKPMHAYVDALRTLLPHLTRERLNFRFAQLIGVYLYFLSEAHRLGEAVGAGHPIMASSHAMEEIVDFASAGLSQ